MRSSTRGSISWRRPSPPPTAPQPRPERGVTMIVRDCNELVNSDRHVFSEGWDSVRLLLKGDNMGFSRSEEHTSELQSLMRISYAVFCLKKKIETIPQTLIKKTQQTQ